MSMVATEHFEKVGQNIGIGKKDWFWYWIISKVMSIGQSLGS
jgi:hypothetical protein